MNTAYSLFKHRSFWFDLEILVETIRIVVAGGGRSMSRRGQRRGDGDTRR
jgi:lipopolysaccharide/colanic/teichoic acid biosynthesis glycosyltransferase